MYLLFMVKKFLDDFKQFLDALIRTDDSRKRSAFLIHYTNSIKCWILLAIIFK